MGKTDYLIYGGGSHSRVVISILEKIGIQIAGIFDTNNRLKKIKKIDKIIFAYEPVWSIGTGKVLTNKELAKQVIIIKKIIKNKFKNQKTKIIYGGSVNNQNINKLKQIREINGFLIGGASQNSKKFIDIIKKTIN